LTSKLYRFSVLPRTARFEPRLAVATLLIGMTVLALAAVALLLRRASRQRLGAVRV